MKADYFYHYDSVTLEYTNTTDADYDPIANQLMIPAFATIVKPLNTRANYACIFINNNWQYVLDNRGRFVWNKTTKESRIVEHIGELSEEWTFLEPNSIDVWSIDKWSPDSTLASEQLLSKRKKLLAETDWYVTYCVETGKDIPANVKEYRQALRDITLNPKFPFCELPQLLT